MSLAHVPTMLIVPTIPRQKRTSQRLWCAAYQLSRPKGVERIDKVSALE